MMKDSSRAKLPFGLLELDPEGEVIRYSPASEQHSDMKAGDVLGRHFFREVLPYEHLREAQARFQLFMAHGETIDRFSTSFDSKEGRIKVQVLLARIKTQTKNHNERLALVRLMPDGNL
ncbi:MAG TPA: PAS domain-containing protein [Pyrinomonadaceae bacterium]|nr:PAS domain-containing protein [Pyrinomonadaceae bacterium]